MTYDAAGNPTLLLDANGTSVTQGFDTANRLTARTIVRGSGVEGPTAETFAYDGLSRLTQVQSGSHVTSHTYDSLSRRLTETTNGRTLTYQHDDAGNPTQQLYPAGTSLTHSFDALNRLQAVTSGSGEEVTYGFRGADLVASKSLGNGLAGATTYDPARRPIRSTLGGSNFDPFTELLSWSPRNLKTAVQREDLNGAGYIVAYDDAGRLVEAAKTENPLALAPNNSAPTAATVAALPDSFGYTYDAAENLLAQQPERYTIERSLASPSDDSGRHRPGSFAGQPLAWDGNGNLTAKGPVHFAWDYRNRLARVTRDGVGEIARYEYDAFNRLTTRVVASETQEWVWSGWQLVERYANGALAMRRIYGQGLDEVVRQEADGDGDGILETVTIPLYDSIGNAVAITDQSGKAIERYDYAPYGTRTIRVDLNPPAVEQLREANGQLLLELSEEILLARVEQAIASGGLTLHDTTDDEPVAIAASQPVRDGKQKGRRLLLTPDPGSPPEPNHGMLLHIEPGAMVDLFENRPETAYDKVFVWLAADHAIDDTTPPRVDLLLTKAGELELGFSEEIDPAVASAAILLDGATRTWTALPDGYTLKPAGAISATTHTLQVGPALIDKAGNSLTEPFSHTITTGAADQITYERPDPRITPISTLDNLASFQGHITDPATGLVYMRNRWMDPEMGRFLSADPLGFVDGPSEYAFAGNSPVAQSDPLGLAVYVFDGTTNNRYDASKPKTNAARILESVSSGAGEYEMGIGGEGGPDWWNFPAVSGERWSSIVDSMYAKLIRNYRQGDTRIDVFGFSRGSSLAREFVNRIRTEGIPVTRIGQIAGPWGGSGTMVFEDRVYPRVDFLGLFDSVAAFALNQGAGIRLSIPPGVNFVRHAFAADEKRWFFPLESVKCSPSEVNSDHVTEQAFAGVHADIGGGNAMVEPSSRASLLWLWSEARKKGVPLGQLDERGIPAPSAHWSSFLHDSSWGIDFYFSAFAEQFGFRVKREVNYHCAD